MGNDVLRAAGLVLELHQLDTTLMDKKKLFILKNAGFILSQQQQAVEKNR